MHSPGRLSPFVPARVAVFRALQLGDLLCAVPGLRALRAALPNAEITLIGLPWAEQFVRRFGSYLDGFIAFPGHPGMPEQPADLSRFASFLNETRARQFDLVIQMHGSGTITNPLVQLFGGGTVAGFFPAGGYCPDPRWFLPFPEREPEVRALLALMAHLGMPSQGEHLEFPLLNEDVFEREELYGQAGLSPETYVCLHAGARLRSRRWPAERFAAVGDALAARGLTVVLTGSPDETDLVAQVASAMQSPSVNLCARTTLGGLAALVASARLVVCNDTGLSHIAAAVRTPSVVIASGSDAGRWAPLDRARHPVLSFDVPCRPCAFEVCPIDHPCALAITPEQVLKQAEAVLVAKQRVAG